jgi:hypothetical protein
MASFGPWRRSRLLSVLSVAGLRLRAPVGCGLARNQNLPFLDEPYVFYECIKETGQKKKARSRETLRIADARRGTKGIHAKTLIAMSVEE